MTLFRTAHFAAAALMIPGTLFAQDYSGGVTLGYGKSDISDTSEDLTTLTIDLGGRIHASDRLFFGGSLGLANIDGDGGGDLSLNYFSGEIGFKPHEMFELGLYAEKSEADLGVFIGDASVTSFGAMVGAQYGGVDVSAFLGKSETDPDLPSGVDVTDAGLQIGRDFASGAFITARVGQSRVTDGTDDARMTIVGLAGGYRITPAMTVFAGVSRATIEDLDGDLTTAGIGLSYDLTNMGPAPITLSGEFVRSDLDAGAFSGEMDTIRFGLSIPFGNAAASAPRNSVASSIANPRRNTLSAALIEAF